MGAEQSRNGAGGVPASGVPPGVSTLGPSLQKRFSKGIQYNMKVVIKGDRNVGKTCLFYRLQGQTFKEEYTPTQEIQVACIQWNYKATDDVVKVEIWDIVDKGKVKKRPGLKMDTEDLAPTLDAEFIDVYKGTSGVIMMLDITKYWTYEYTQRELNKVPLDIPVIIMGGHRDLEEKRAVLSEEVHTFISELDRPGDAAAVYYMEASMKDGFGLKYLYRFFNVPFLELQRQTLLAQLRRNEEDLEAIKVELDVHEQSEEQDYDMFRDVLDRKRKGLPTNGVCTVAAGANELADSTTVTEDKDVGDLKDGTAMSLRSRLSEKVLQNTPLPAKLTVIPASNNQSIDNFVPEGNLDSNFLNNSRGPSPRPSPKPIRAQMGTVEISDSDEEPVGNPQVTIDQESPDEDDIVVATTNPQLQLSLTSTGRKSPDRHKNPPSPVPRRSPNSKHRSGQDVELKQNAQKDKKPAVQSDMPPDEDNAIKKQTSVITDEEFSDAADSSTVVSARDVVHMEPAPLQRINPALPPREVQPIDIDSDIIAHDTTTDVIIMRDEGNLTRDEDNITRYEGNLTRDAEPDVNPPREHITENDFVTPEDVIVPTNIPPSIVPQIDLEILEKVSCAPPIANKTPSPKEARRRREEKTAPPKKSLLDINLTSSDEEDPEVQDDKEEIENKEDVFAEQVLTTFEEPPKSPTKRLGSSGSLKLTHNATIPDDPVSIPVEPVKIIQKKEKKKKKAAQLDNKTAEEIREKKERDELEDFFGGEEVKERPKKKKPKKKKPKNVDTVNNPGADDYEQF